MRLSPITLLALAACGDNFDLQPDERRQGGELTVDDRTREAFEHPAPTLDSEQLYTHNLGRGPFNFEWRPPQLGPLFNHSGCLACHGRNGRGLSSLERGVFGSQALVRVSLTDGTPDVPGGNVSVPGYGQQLQDHATVGTPEVYLTLEWRENVVYYGDGTPQPLRAPFITMMQPDGAPLPTGVASSYRQGLPLVGLGLLEAIPDDTILALEDPTDADGDGISGRANIVWDDVTHQPRLGRFGHKANVVDLLQQVAGAFVNDIGLTNLIFPEPDGMRDVNDDQLVQTAFFLSTLGVPTAAPRDEAARRGRSLFDDFACSTCHVPTLVTGDHEIPQLAQQTIHPYTDLLLHDVGDLLTDARSDFAATGVEWRTPPLWGIGLAQVVQPEATFLHDGRARTLAEAILWHGGEAEAAREAFRLASPDDRDALLAFLQTL
ncbi:MAG TPA: di-heme oxidoredictase family protein [Kofleriaceae bacterium]|nr:di-heme oxidoredictase family protein [Kofleriaceae bacterium]